MDAAERVMSHVITFARASAYILPVTTGWLLTLCCSDHDSTGVTCVTVSTAAEKLDDDAQSAKMCSTEKLPTKYIHGHALQQPISRMCFIFVLLRHQLGMGMGMGMGGGTRGGRPSVPETCSFLKLLPPPCPFQQSQNIGTFGAFLTFLTFDFSQKTFHRKLFQVVKFGASW